AVSGRGGRIRPAVNGRRGQAADPAGSARARARSSALIGPGRSTSSSAPTSRTSVEGRVKRTGVGSSTTGTGSVSPQSRRSRLVGSTGWPAVPERLTLVAVTGAPVAAMTWRVAGWSGIRTPTMPPAVTSSSGRVGRCRTTTESCPGVNRPSNRRAASLRCAYSPAMARPLQATCMGWVNGRALTANAARTAGTAVASAASRGPVSVGRIARPPERRWAAIRSASPTRSNPEGEAGDTNWNLLTLALRRPRHRQTRPGWLRLGWSRLSRLGQLQVGHHLAYPLHAEGPGPDQPGPVADEIDDGGGDPHRTGAAVEVDPGGGAQLPLRARGGGRRGFAGLVRGGARHRADL